MKIGELAKATNTQVETIRYYEREGLVPATARSDANYRVYGESHVARLSFIRHCRGLDMSLEEIRVLLQFQDSPQQDCARVNQLLDEHIGHVAARIKELKGLERQLKTLREACHDAQRNDACGIMTELRTASQSAASRRVTTPHIHATHSRPRTRPN